jgi:hypothetical protein
MRAENEGKYGDYGLQIAKRDLGKALDRIAAVNKPTPA